MLVMHFSATGLVEAHDPNGDVFGFLSFGHSSLHVTRRPLGHFLLEELYSLCGAGSRTTSPSSRYDVPHPNAELLRTPTFPRRYRKYPLS